MRTYGYRCVSPASCLIDTEAMRATEDRYDAPPCKCCGGPTQLRIFVVTGAVENPAVSSSGKRRHD